MSAADALLDEIEKTVTETVRPFSEAAVAYSGGLDSTLIAALAGRVAKVRCYCACVESSFDQAHVREFARKDGLEAEILVISDADLEELVRRARGLLPAADPVTVSYTVPLLCVIERAREEAVLVGNGADEIFAGYAKYETAMDREGQAAYDLKKAISEVDTLADYAQKRHKVLLAPYAHERVVRLASSIDMTEKLGPEGRKLVLRECARKLGLEASDRPKKAAQYSSGVSKRLKQLAKGSGKGLQDWIEGL